MTAPDRPMNYILDEHGNPQPCDDLMTWARWFKTADRTVSNDYDEGDEGKTIRVSTVFLGLDHNFIGSGPPILYETMVFGGVLDGEMDRYATREEAMIGHQEMCRRVCETLEKRDGHPR
jgi:hypothetical protein